MFFSCVPGILRAWLWRRPFSIAFRLDLKTVRIVKEVLDDAWHSLDPERQAVMSKTVLAESILMSAAKGERDRERLLAAALRIAAWVHPQVTPVTWRPTCLASNTVTFSSAREINMNLEMRIILCSHEFGQVVGRTDAVAHPARRGVIHL
jgi:hypothetical protein